MSSVSETTSFLGAGVHVSYTSASYKANQEVSLKEEEKDKVILRLDATKTNKPEEYLTRSQINMMLAEAKKMQQASQEEAATPELVEPKTVKPDSVPEVDDEEVVDEEEIQEEKSREVAKQEEYKPREVPKEPEKIREEPPPVKTEEKKADLALEYTRNENEKARDTAVREFLTVGMTSRFVESQAATA